MVAQVAQVPLHVVDGGAAVVAEGAPAQGVPISTGLGGFGDIYGGENIGSESHRGCVKSWEGWGAGVEAPKPHKGVKRIVG